MDNKELLSQLENKQAQLAQEIESLRIYTEQNDFDSIDKYFSKEQLKPMRDYLETLTNRINYIKDRIKHYEE